MPRLTIEQIAQADDLGEEEIEIPEWGGSVVIRGLGYGEWMDIRDASVVAGQQDEKIFARLLLAAALVEPPITAEQADLLLNKSAPSVDRVTSAILSMSKIGDEAIQEAEATFPGES